MGYDGEFFSRLDWVEKGTRLRNLTAEMIWKASDNLEELSHIFTSVLYNHYSAPSGFCFDNLCTDPPIVDDDGPENNVDERVSEASNSSSPDLQSFCFAGNKIYEFYSQNVRLLSHFPLDCHNGR